MEIEEVTNSPSPLMLSPIDLKPGDGFFGCSDICFKVKFNKNTNIKPADNHVYVYSPKTGDISLWCEGTGYLVQVIDAKLSYSKRFK